MRRRPVPLNEQIIESVAQRFRALGEPQRLRILQALEVEPRTVSDVVKLLGSSQPNVSRHLQSLFEAGLVKRRRSRTSIVYSVRDPLVFRLCSLVCDSVVDQARSGLAEMAAARGSAPLKGAR
jgi:DNA-binding transcriptional ArsR family regulator